eukprot:TRINITY_DN1593_c6_g1_i1.p1 TRINITY_DN1593_c6_g1~~TRINITY_DN1593_c6_g1_i1.p1  ORF type:complete len:705 (+),score=95.54 TRINITY_DN1593_c6_g1_i1:137-2251(+)
MRGDFRESRVQRIIKDARATLTNPTRPETPADTDRMFYGKGMSRQNTPVTLQPMDFSCWDSGNRNSSGTPQVSEAAAKAKQSKELFSEAGRKRTSNASNILTLDDDTDPNWKSLSTLLTLIHSEHSTETLQVTLHKMNQLVDQLLATNSLLNDPRLESLLLHLNEHFENCNDSTIIIRHCRIRLKCGRCDLQTMSQLYNCSKSESNDCLFRQEQIIEPILSVLETSKEIEVVTLAAGVIKNISINTDNQTSLATLGAIRILTATCKSQIALAVKKDSMLRSHIDLLIQATASLRNLSTTQSHGQLFTKLGTISVLHPVVCSQLNEYEEVVLNTCRIMSKLSHLDECKLILNRDPSNLSSLVKICVQYKNSQPICVRVLYTLGNLLQNTEANRGFIGSAENAALLKSIEDLFVYYCEVDERIVPEGDGACEVEENSKKPAALTESTDSAIALRESDERLVKIVRILANLAISHDVGPLLAANAAVVEGIISLVTRKTVDQSEELVLNTVCCITNLSFYDGIETNLILDNQIKIGDAIAMLLMHDHVDAVVEVARTFGNFSRSEEMRVWMMQCRVDEACAILVDHSDRRIVLAVCGVLLNYSADINHVQLFAQYNLLSSLFEVHQVVESTDLELLTVIHKLYFNLADKGFLTNVAGEVRNQVIEFLSASQTLPPSDPNLDEFTEVTTNLADLLSQIIVSPSDCSDG